MPSSAFCDCCGTGDRMRGEPWIGKDLEGLEVLSQYFPRWPEENQKDLSLGRCLFSDSNVAVL